MKEEVHIPVRMLRQLYPLLDRAGWKITVSLSWNGEKWELVDIESGIQPDSIMGWLWILEVQQY